MEICIYRLEKVNIKRRHSQAKILGIIVTVGGAMIMTLVKGPTIGLPWTNDKIDAQSSTTTSATGNSQNHIKGSLMIIAGCFCWASFVILQVRLIFQPFHLHLYIYIYVVL